MPEKNKDPKAKCGDNKILAEEKDGVFYCKSSELMGSFWVSVTRKFDSRESAKSYIVLRVTKYFDEKEEENQLTLTNLSNEFWQEYLETQDDD